MKRDSKLQLTALTALLCGVAACGGNTPAGQDSSNGAGQLESPAPAPSPSPASSPIPAPAPAQSATGTAALSWTSSQDSDLQGYRVYYSTASGSYAQARGAGVDVGAATSFVVQGLERNRTYYFAVTSYDAAGNESAYSTQVSKVIP